MTTPQSANKKISEILEERIIRWNKIKQIVALHSTLDSVRRQALKKACLDVDVCISTLKLLLKKTDVDLIQRVNLIQAAVRCKNILAVETFVYDDVSVLYFEIGNGRRNTLLHIVCEKHGWTREVAFILKETLENRNQDDYRHEGMFHNNYKMHTPFKLALEAGAELEEVIQHLQEEFPSYFESNLQLLPEIIAEYSLDVSVLEKLIEKYSKILKTRSDNSTPLHYACYYQNEGMIHLLLAHYLKQGNRQKRLLSRLLTLNSENETPLRHLVLGLGSSDCDNSFSCLMVVMMFVENLHILHIIVEKMWDILAEESACLRTVTRVVQRLNVNLSGVDHHGKTVMSHLITKMVSSQSEQTLEVMDYILQNSNVAYVRDGRKKLPLHIACESGLRWDYGLRTIVNANMIALEELDQKAKILPFVLAATTSSHHLDEVYNLLRCNPGVI